MSVLFKKEEEGGGAGREDLLAEKDRIIAALTCEVAALRRQAREQAEVDMGKAQERTLGGPEVGDPDKEWQDIVDLASRVEVLEQVAQGWRGIAASLRKENEMWKRAGNLLLDRLAKRKLQEVRGSNF